MIKQINILRSALKENLPSSYINKVYIIKSTKYNERYINTRLLCDELGFHDVEHFDAIYPTDKMVKDDNGREYECPLKIGEIGCIMSHRKLWKKIMEMKDDKDKAKWIIVFEDDIQIPKDVEMWQIRTVINAMLIHATYTDIDVVYLGHCYHDLCTHAYAIRPKSAQTLYNNTNVCNPIETMEPKRGVGKPTLERRPRPIDGQMLILHKKNVIKCTYAPQFTRRGGH
jgi:GR25 family glycosyltransferase involved in LPS biosynthesis